MNNNNSFLINLFQNLNNLGIKYCVLRNYKSLPFNTNGSDLDLWVSSNNIKNVINIIEDISNKTNCKLVSYIENKYSPKYCFQNTIEGVQIDLFYGDMYFQNNIIFKEKTIEQSIKLYNNIYVLDDNLADLISLIKELVNNGFCKSKYILPIYKNSHLYDKDFLYSNLECFNNEFVESLNDSIQKKNIEQNIKHLYKEARMSFSSNIFLNKTKKIKRLFQKRPGYVVVVEGTDGSGKSTIINAITPILNEGFHNGTIYNHLRPNVIPDLGVLMGKKKKTEGVTVVSNPHAEKQSGFAGSLVRWAYYMIDYTFGYLKSVYPVIHTKSKVFIFDRYYYDYYIDQKRSRTNLPKWVLRFGELFLPKPDIILCLGGAPKKIYERKPETSLEEVTRQTNALKEFCNSKKNAVWVDTTTTPQESIDAAMNAICDVMSKRFSNFKFK